MEVPEQEDVVWFDRGHGPEKATVYAADEERIACYVGNPALERVMLSYEAAFPSRSAVLDARGVM